MEHEGQSKLCILQELCELFYPESGEVSQPSPAPEHPANLQSLPPKIPAGQKDTVKTLLSINQY